MVELKIKPLSANEAFKGRRFKTDKYKSYYKEVLLRLPSDLVMPGGDLIVYYEFGLSNSQADWDNSIKQFQDCLAKKYRFNDKKIQSGLVKKTIVPKGNEFIRFYFMPANGYEFILSKKC